MGTDPLENLPPTSADFPLIVQIAYAIVVSAPDDYAGSGQYIGKRVTDVSSIMDIYGVRDKECCLDFINTISETINKKAVSKANKNIKAASEPNKNPIIKESG